MKLSKGAMEEANKRADLIIAKYDQITISHQDAIECALLCVTEIIIVLEEDFGRRMLFGIIDYWEGVHKIIEFKLKEHIV